MPHDRRTGRVLLAMMGLVGVAISVGCMRSSNLRTSAGPLPELSPAGELHPVAAEATPGAGSPPPANAAASWSRNAITPPPRPALDPGPTPDGPAASPSRAVPAARLAPEGTDPVDAPAPAPGGPSSASPAPAGERPAPPTTSPTPLLDAEIRRAQAVTRQHIESLKAADTPPTVVNPVVTPPDPPAMTPEPASAAEPKPAESKPVDTDPDVVAPLPLAASPQTAVGSETAGSPGTSVVPPLIPIDPLAAGSAPPVTTLPPQALTTDSQGPQPNQVAAIADAREIDRRATEPTPTRPESGAPDDPQVVAHRTGGGPSPPGGPSPQANRDERPPLEIAALRLCSKVKKFGEIEPVDPDTLKPGQRVLVYCEMTGLEYQASGDVFISRLAAHFELRSGMDGPVIWEQAPDTAKDLCHRPPRDYYVSYVIEFPKSLEPGPYLLRLIQTDLIGNRATSREIPVTIVRFAAGSR